MQCLALAQGQYGLHDVLCRVLRAWHMVLEFRCDRQCADYPNLWGKVRVERWRDHLLQHNYQFSSYHWPHNWKLPGRTSIKNWQAQGCNYHKHYWNRERPHLHEWIDSFPGYRKASSWDCCRRIQCDFRQNDHWKHARVACRKVCNVSKCINMSWLCSRVWHGRVPARCQGQSSEQRWWTMAHYLSHACFYRHVLDYPHLVRISVGADRLLHNDGIWRRGQEAHEACLSQGWSRFARDNWTADRNAV